MAKVSIKSGDYTAFGGIFQIMELFERKFSPVINRTLGTSIFDTGSGGGSF